MNDFSVSIADGSRPRSPDGRKIVQTPKSGREFQLLVSDLDDDISHVYGRVPGCYDDGAYTPALDWLQL